MSSVPPSVAACLALCVALAGCAHEPEREAAAAVKQAEKPKLASARAIPLPRRELLAAPTPPSCEAKTAAPSQRPPDHGQRSSRSAALEIPLHATPTETARPGKSMVDISSTRAAQASDLEQRIALEYERACYKQAEVRVRGHLEKLQAAVRVTINAVRQIAP